MHLVFAKTSWVYKVFPYFKWTVYVLLSINVYLFFTEQTLVEGIDSLAWVVLLLLFEWETSELGKPALSKWKKYGIHLVRLVAYVFVVVSAIEYSTASYIAENGRLDMYNSWIWLGVVIALEYDVYFPGYYRKWEWWLRNALKIVMYAALIVIALLWGMENYEGAWLDFYDALLWILCFFAIELNVFRFEEEIPFQEEVEANPELAKEFDEIVH
jgi:hypothetical protein